MSDQYISLENLKFLLHDVHRVAELFTLDYFKEFNKEAIDMVIDAAKDFSDKELFPYLAKMDQQGGSSLMAKLQFIPRFIRF